MQSITVFEKYKLTDLHGYTITEDYGYNDRRSDYREVIGAEKNGKKYIIKIGRAKFPSNDLNRTFENEIIVCELMSHKKIGVSVIETWKTLVYDEENNKSINILCMVMPKWNTTYQEFRANTDDLKVRSEISTKLHELLYDSKT